MTAAGCPPISVVIPTFNRGPLLKRALDSIVAQTARPFEVIVSDDGSTDDTREVVSQFESMVDLTYVYNPNSGLPARARNVGLAKARGEFVAFLDSDDWWATNKLAAVAPALLAGRDVVYHPMTKVPRTSIWWWGRRARSRPLRTPAIDDLLRRGNVIPNSSAVVRRSLLDEVGGLDESTSVRTWEDFDLWLRLARSGATFECVDECLGSYATEGGVTNPSQTLLNMQSISERWFGTEADPPGWMHMQRAGALSMLGRHREALAEAARASSRATSLRFASDVALVAGLVLRESFLSLKPEKAVR